MKAEEKNAKGLTGNIGELGKATIAVDREAPERVTVDEISAGWRQAREEIELNSEAIPS